MKNGFALLCPRPRKALVFTEIIPDCGNDGPEKSLEEPVDKLTKKGDKKLHN